MQLHLEYLPRRATIRERQLLKITVFYCCIQDGGQQIPLGLDRCGVSRPLRLSWLCSLGSVSGTGCLCHGSPLPWVVSDGPLLTSGTTWGEGVQGSGFYD